MMVDDDGADVAPRSLAQCRHITHVSAKKIKEAVSARTETAYHCDTCRADDVEHSLWLCLSCAHIGCGRYDSAHASKHYATRPRGPSHLHACVLELSTLQAHCYFCESTVAESVRVPAIDKLRQFLLVRRQAALLAASAGPPLVLKRPRGRPRKVPLLLPNGAPAPPSAPSGASVRGKVSVKRAFSAVSRVRKNGSTSLGAGAASSSSTAANGGGGALRLGAMYDAPGARGISNAGNTCFLSATIQALSHAHLLRDFWLLLPQRLAVQATAPSDAQAFATASRMRRTATMLGDRRLQLLTRDRDGDSGETTTVESVTCAVQDLVKQLWLPTDLFASSAALSSGAKRRAADGAYGGDVRTQVLNAEALLAVVWRCMPKFGGYQQHDAHEFLRYLLDRVDIELRNIDEPWPASMTPLLTSLGGDASSTVSVSSSSSSSSSSSAAPSGVSLLPRRAAAVAAAAKTSGSAPTRSSGTGVAGGAASNGVSSTSSKRDVTLGARNSLRLATAASSKEHQPTRAAAAAVAAAAPPPPPDSPTASPPTSIVKSLFGATLLSAVRCDGCRLLSTQHELHLDLSLDVPLDVPSTSLAECLDRYILPCRLDKADKYRCAHCRRAMPATKRVALESVPRILCLHFKRFRWQPPLPPKVNTLVSFPAELDMLPYVDASVRDTIATSTKYRLFAVINHLGKACGSGHYTAMCLDEAAAAATAAAAAAATAASAVTTAPSDANGASTAAEAVNDSAAAPTWIEYDDRNVRRVAFDSVVSPNAYLLFYERVDTPPSTLQPSQWIESVAADEPASNAIDDDAADGGTHLPKRMRDRI